MHTSTGLCKCSRLTDFCHIQDVMCKIASNIDRQICRSVQPLTTVLPVDPTGALSLNFAGGSPYPQLSPTDGIEA